MHRDKANTIKCREWRTKYKVVPGASWGDLPPNHQEEWKTINCDEYLVEVKETVPSADCTNINAKGMSGFASLGPVLACAFGSHALLTAGLRSEERELTACVLCVMCLLTGEEEMKKLPLISIMAAATTRNVKNIKLKRLALFKVGQR